MTTLNLQLPSVFPLPERFAEYLEDYCTQALAASREGKHHDHRRALLMDFLRKGFGIEVEEIELEHKVKVASARGRIDAFYRFVIFEVKTDLDRERDDAIRELKKYFESQTNPGDYVAAVTDGITFEVYDYNIARESPQLVRSFDLQAEFPVVSYTDVDELLAAGRKIPPLSTEVVKRFGSTSITFLRSRNLLADAFSNVKKLAAVHVKFHEWNALLAKVYGSSPDDEELFITHTYLTMVSRAIVAVALYREGGRGKTVFRGLMNGDFFRNRNIQNLAEPDFFSWALDTPVENVFFDFFANLFRRLDEFEWSGVESMKICSRCFIRNW